MKRDSVPHFLLVLGVLGAAGMIIWPGCMTMPLPKAKEPLTNLQASRFRFAAGSEPTRAELVARFGQPDDWFSDLRVACYRLNRINEREQWLFLGVLPAGQMVDTVATEVALLQFDQQDRVRRSAIRTIAYSVSLRQTIERWLAEPKPVPMGTKR
jgi:hypothetical protein